jgi:hypothetical protein
MTEPTQSEEPTKTTRAKGAAASSDAGQPAPAPKTAAADAPADQPSGTSSSSGAEASASQLTGAMSGAVSDLMTRLQRSEQLALSGAGLVLGVYIVFQFLLDKFILSEVSVVVALLLVLAIWVHRWGHHDFGSAYRITLAGLGSHWPPSRSSTSWHSSARAAVVAIPRPAGTHPVLGRRPSYLRGQLAALPHTGVTPALRGS